jgi:hypothetical protein
MFNKIRDEFIHKPGFIRACNRYGAPHVYEREFTNFGIYIISKSDSITGDYQWTSVNIPDNDLYVELALKYG